MATAKRAAFTAPLQTHAHEKKAAQGSSSTVTSFFPSCGRPSVLRPSRRSIFHVQSPLHRSEHFGSQHCRFQSLPKRRATTRCAAVTPETESSSLRTMATIIIAHLVAITFATTLLSSGDTPATQTHISSTTPSETVTQHQRNRRVAIGGKKRLSSREKRDEKGTPLSIADGQRALRQAQRRQRHRLSLLFVLGIAVGPALIMVAPRYILPHPALRTIHMDLISCRKGTALRRPTLRSVFPAREAKGGGDGRENGDGDGRKEALAVASWVFALLIKHPTIGVVALLSLLVGVVIVRGEREGQMARLGMEVVRILTVTATAVGKMLLMWLQTRCAR